MLYKPGKSHKKVASSGSLAGNVSPSLSTANPSGAPKQQQQQQQQQQHHRWHRLGQILGSIGPFSWFGSHQSIASTGEGGVAKEDHHQHPKSQQNQPQQRRLQRADKQHHRPSAAVSCQNLARASAQLLNGDIHCGVGSTNSDDEEGQPGANRVAKWATGLGHLLADPVGVGVFAEFLRGEFSDENIHFWLAVEAFKGLDDGSDEIFAAAHRIAGVHIGCEAPAGVNLDGATVRDLQSRLRRGQPPPDRQLFNAAQEHIFNLMRLDSYARFLKSPPYKDCLLCELESRPLPTPPAASSRLGSEDTLAIPAFRSLQQQQPVSCSSTGITKLSQSWFLTPSPAQQTDPSGSSPRSRRLSPIVAALDLDCGFSVC